MSSDTDGTTTDGNCGYPTGSGACQNPAGPDGTCHIDSHATYSDAELRMMSREVAEAELHDEAFQRWERWQDLSDRAEQNKADLEAADATTVDALVQADMGELSTDVTLYGNDVEVFVNFGEDLREIGAELEDAYADADAADPSDADVERLSGLLAEFFAAVFVSFNGADVQGMPKSERHDLGAACVRKWGLRGAFHALLDIMQATDEDMGQLEDRVEKFRDPARRGDR